MAGTLDQVSAALRDRYDVIREVGRGSMAVVYLAEDLKHRRKVAVKVLRPELAQGIGTERFLREIDLAARLNHPHIIPLFDSGKSDIWLFYVMPYIEGETLRSHLEVSKQLSIEESVHIATQVASALS